MICGLVIFKCFQLLVVVAVGVLFGMPQKIKVSPDVRDGVEMKTNLSKLACRMGDSTTTPTDEQKQRIKEHLKLQLNETMSDVLELTGQCQVQKDDKKKRQCECMHDYRTASAVAASAVFSLIISYDLIMIFVVMSRKSEWSPAITFCSCVFTILAFAIWSALGSVNVWLLVEKWPYYYQKANLKKPFHYYQPPIFWYIAVGFCFLFALMSLVEFIVLCALAKRGAGRWKDICQKEERRPKIAPSKSVVRGKSKSHSIGSGSGSKSLKSQTVKSRSESDSARSLNERKVFSKIQTKGRY